MMVRRSKVMPTRRLSRSKPTTARVDKDAAYAAVCTDLKLIAKLDAKADELAQTRAEIEERIKKQMAAAELDQVDDGVYDATYKGTMGKSSREIDPKRFQKAVKPEAFWSAVSVSVTKAKEYLTDKEIDSISEVTAGTMGEKKLNVKRKAKGKR